MHSQDSCAITWVIISEVMDYAGVLCIPNSKVGIHMVKKLP